MPKDGRGRREPFIPDRKAAVARGRATSRRGSSITARHRARRPPLTERLAAWVGRAGVAGRPRVPRARAPGSRGPGSRAPETRAPETRSGEGGPVARGRRVQRLFRVLSFALVLGLGAILFLTSSAFGVSEIVVTGGIHLSSDEIVRLCDVRLGMNILKVSTGAIRERLESLPRVAVATVSRRLPGTLVIRLVEREGVALLPCEQQYAELDSGGLPLEFHRYVGALGLPVITGVSLSGVTLGTRLDGADLTAALCAATALGQEGRARIAEIHVDKGELLLYAREGTPIYVGQAVGLDAKVTALLGILDDIDQNGLKASYVDVRYPRYPVVGAAGGPPEPAEWQWEDPDVPVLVEP